MYKKAILFLLVVVPTVCWGQDPNFTQFYVPSLNINPSLAGAIPHYRLSTAYRNQWSAAGSPYQTFIASFDYNFDHAGAGLGGQLIHDRVDELGYEQSGVSVNGSINFSASKKWGFRPGLGFTYLNRSINYNNLVFGDELITGSTQERFPAGSTSYISVSTGLVAYNEHFWFGFSAYHLNKPEIGITQSQTLAPRINLHAGAKLDWYTEAGRKPSYTLMPAILYQKQGSNSQMDIGTNILYKQMLAGIWYRGIPIRKGNYGIVNQDALAITLGFQYELIRIGYSYDFTISRLSGSGGAHELTFVIRPKSDRRYKGGDKWHDRIQCPAFIP